jgi:hypothetical protein
MQNTPQTHTHCLLLRTRSGSANMALAHGRRDKLQWIQYEGIIPDTASAHWAGVPLAVSPEITRSVTINRRARPPLSPPPRAATC